VQGAGLDLTLILLEMRPDESIREGHERSGGRLKDLKLF
jgi:hypothetical protein